MANRRERVNVARLIPHVSWVEELDQNGDLSGAKYLVVSVDVSDNSFNVRVSPSKIKTRCNPENYVYV